MKYHKSILGGTFDHFHKGHKKLLDAAFSQSNQVTIGLTTEQFYKHKLLSSEIESYGQRENHLKAYLTKQGYTTQATIMQLTDIYGPALTEKNIDAIFVTKDTLSGAQKINTERKIHGFSELAIELIDFELADDHNPITSERIRLGDINNDGASYTLPLLKKHILKLPLSLRETLRTPIGEIYTNIQKIASLKHPLLVTVGDIVTKDLLSIDVQPDISIIDLKSQRQELQAKEKKSLYSRITTTFINAPATINTDFFSEFTRLRDRVLATQHKEVVLVTGEEDLLTLPTILLAPLNSLVIYGQQHLGAIAVTITAEKKDQVRNLLNQFD